MGDVFLEWESIGDRKEKGHVMSMPYGSLEEGEKGQLSEWVQSLKGTWKFNLAKNAAFRPVDFYRQDKDLETWADIQVPGVWQLQGFDQDPPYFLKDDYPPAVMKSHIPSIKTEDNTVGSYKKLFFVPKAWQDREVFICFAGVKSAFYLWINGNKVGYSQGSMTPAEFNIGSFLLFGEENSVSVEVYRYCVSTYLEGHGTWYFSGIYRDVYIYAEPKVSLRDYFLSCQFDNCYEDAFFKIQTEITNVTGESQPISIEIYLEDGLIKDSRLVAKSHQTTRLVLETLVKMPLKWTAETPYLYGGAIVLKDSKGQVLTVKRFDFGFRTVGIEMGVLVINGQPIKLKGINRHDFDPDAGCTVSKSQYEQDIKLLKQFNVNAIRTSYYPNDDYFYHLCDRYGLYVMNESGVQVHPIGKEMLIGNRDEWCDMMVDRMERMVVRDRNHPSVIIWSLGNEEGLGKNFLEMKRAAMALDGSRPYHYEGDLDFRTSDFFSSQSGSLAWMDAVGNHDAIDKKLLLQSFPKKSGHKKGLDPLDYRDKPALLCAFAPGNENGMGDIKAYMDKFEAYNNWCGGFIYDFMDQAIRKSVNGEDQWLYGGDFGEESTSGYQCASGIFSADRTLHPTAFEVKKVYQSYRIEEIDWATYQIALTKKGAFLDTNRYYLRWEILEDGGLLIGGEEEMMIFNENESQKINLNIEDYKKVDGAEYHLNINMCLKEPTLWADEDHIVAWEQLKIPSYIRPKAKKTSQKALIVHDRKIKTEIIGEDFSCRISKLTGDITSLTYDHKEYLVSPLKLNFYRAATDNDLETSRRVRFKLKLKTDWKKVSESYKVQKVSIDNLKTEVVIQVMRKVKHIKNNLITEYTIDGGGNVYISHQLTPKRNMVKFGTSMDISDEYNTLSWFGNGLLENYSDRQLGAKVGVYSCDVKEYVHNYLRPQENSNRTDIRWFSATTQDGEGLFFEDVEGTLLNMSAWPYNMKDLDEAEHIHALRARNTITLNIDYKQKGVGSEEEKGISLNDQHRKKKNVEYKYGYKICKAY